ncbi:MAG: methyltransferase family protein [Promethearchaeota archaeon]
MSRNPMYVAFFLSYFGTIFYTLNIFIIILSIIGITIHHKIVINEEKFLEKRFGDDYFHYKKRVRRYL